MEIATLRQSLIQQLGQVNDLAVLMQVKQALEEEVVDEAVDPDLEHPAILRFLEYSSHQGKEGKLIPHDEAMRLLNKWRPER